MSHPSPEKEQPRPPPSIMASLSTIWRNYETTRNLFAFFLLGLSNNFGYVIMLSAAHDLLLIIDKLSHVDPTSSTFIRDCNEISTGAILLASVIPCTVIKLIVPFLPFYIHLRMAVAVLSAAGGLIMVGAGFSKVCIITGICLVSLSQGLGESSLLAYTVFFKSRNVLSTWSSGTGLAGLLGSFSYSLMIQLGMTPKATIFCMLCMPLLMSINFWLVIERPLLKQYERDKADLEMLKAEEKRQQQEEHIKRVSEGIEEPAPRSTLCDNIRTIPKILYTYTIWYGLVYFFEYFINQGLFELVYIPGSFFDHSAQYRWYNTVYQTGVFLSRSSMNLVRIDRTYLTALFQGINVLVFGLEARYGYMTYLPIVFAVILWEGLLGGGCYVNTYRRITVEWPREGREFAMAINSIGDSFTVSLAGVISIPVHDAICLTPPTYGVTPKG